jgi:DNA-binding response OmpR family regulator
MLCLTRRPIIDSFKVDMKVLVVDDDESLSTIIVTALDKEGFTTVSSSNGRDALEKARSELPNLILLDQVLPDISGNEVLKSLKTDEQTKNIPVMMLSNFSQGDMVNQAINSGATDYIYKYQVEVSDIVSKVKTALNMSQQPPQAQ